MHELYELKEKLMKELTEFSENGKFSKENIETIKYLSSAIDHLCNIIMDMEEEYSMEGGMMGGSSSYARGGRGGGQSSYARGGNRGGGQSSYERGGRGGQSSYERGGQSSYARGRGRNARRDSMGRYSSEGGYSGNEEMIEELYGLMEDAPDEKTRKEIEKLAKKLEMM